MPDRTRDSRDLPILDELGHDLGDAFRRAEAAEAAEASAHPAPTGARRATAAPSWSGGLRAALRGRRARWSAAGLVGAAGVAAILALTSGVDHGAVQPAPASAAAVLGRAADAAVRNPVPFPDADQFYVVDSVEMWGAHSATASGRDQVSYATTRRRIWTSETRAGRLRQQTIGQTAVDAPPEPIDAADLRAADGRWRSLSFEAQRTFTVAGMPLTREQVLGLPTDPQVLFRRIRAAVGDAGRSPDGEVFVVIADTLRATPLPAPLRAALYRTLALVPGVELAGTVTDRLGRPALTVSYQEPGTWERNLLLLDPASHAMIGEQTVVADAVGPRPDGVAQSTTTVGDATVPVQDDARPTTPAGTITGESVVLGAGVVDRVGQLPPR